jgi:hypothetical protein
MNIGICEAQRQEQHGLEQHAHQHLHFSPVPRSRTSTRWRALRNTVLSMVTLFCLSMSVSVLAQKDWWNSDIGLSSAGSTPRKARVVHL